MVETSNYIKGSIQRLLDVRDVVSAINLILSNGIKLNL
jgi:hypothetical protein